MARQLSSACNARVQKPFGDNWKGQRAKETSIVTYKKLNSGLLVEHHRSNTLHNLFWVTPGEINKYFLRFLFLKVFSA